MENGKISWRQIGILLAILMATGSAIASHYNGFQNAVEQANAYTNTRINDLKDRIDRMEDNILRELRIKRRIVE